MATASLLPLPRFVAYDPNGAPLAGGFVTTAVPGGTTPKLSWQDAAETIPNENPIPLDANGSAIIYGQGTYQLTVTDSLGNQVPAYSGVTTDTSTIDNATILGDASVGGDLTVTGGITAGPITVTGASSVVGTFNVSASVNFSSTLNVAGLTSLSGVLNCTGGATNADTGPYMIASGAVITPAAWSAVCSVNCSNGIASPGFFTVSDARLKSDVEDITPADGEDWVKRGRPRSYTLDGRPSAGFIAQEDIAAGRQAAVLSIADERPEFAEATEFSAPGQRLSRDYMHDIAYLTAALKSALGRIEALEKSAGDAA